MSSKIPKKILKPPLPLSSSLYFQEKKKKIKPFIKVRTRTSMHCTDWDHHESLRAWAARTPVETTFTRKTSQQASRYALSATLTSALTTTMNIPHRKAVLSHPLNIRAYNRGCLCPHSHPPHPLLSHIHTPWYTWPIWSATKEAKRDQEIISWVKLPFNRKNPSPCHKSSCPKLFFLLKKRTKDYQEDNQRFLHRMIYLRIRNKRIFYKEMWTGT